MSYQTTLQSPVPEGVDIFGLLALVIGAVVLRLVYSNLSSRREGALAQAARAFLSDRQGGVSILSMVILSVMMAAAAFSIQSANLYVTKVQSQRVADLAALAASITTSPVQSGAASATATATAANIAAINGFGSRTVTTTAGTSNGVQTLTTSVSGGNALVLGKFLGGQGSATVAASASVSISPAISGDCLTALSGAMNLNWIVNGPNCGISGASYIYLLGGQITAASIATATTSFIESLYALGVTSLTPSLSSFTYNATVTDQIASKASVAAIKSHLASMSTWPYGSTSPVQFSWKPTSFSTTDITAAGTYADSTPYRNVTLNGATATFSGYGSADPSCLHPTTISGTMTFNGANTLTFNSGCYVIGGGVDVQSGTTTFVTAPGANVTYVFDYYVYTDNATLVMGDATYYFGGDVQLRYGGSMSFGNGQKVFGGGSIYANFGTINFGNGPFYINGGSISQNGSTTTFGTGPFYLWGGSITNNTFGTYNFGSGPYYFYGGSITNGYGAGCPNMSFANGPYYFNGGAISTGVCSATQFGYGNIDMYGGSISLWGNTSFGVNGSAVTGGSTISIRGGAFWLWSGNLTMTGVTLALDLGLVSLGGGGALSLVAPSSASPTYGYQNMLIFAQAGSVTINQIAGPLGSFSGMIYAPGNYAWITGGGTISVANGGCFAIAAYMITLSSFVTTNLAPCPGLTATASAASTAKLQ